MCINEAIKICEERLNKLKNNQQYSVTPLEKELFKKDIAFYEICKNTLECKLDVVND